MFCLLLLNVYEHQQFGLATSHPYNAINTNQGSVLGNTDFH